MTILNVKFNNEWLDLLEIKLNKFCTIFYYDVSIRSSELFWRLEM